MKYFWMIILSVSFMYGGFFSNKKEPTKENFSAALESYFQSEKQNDNCFFIGVFPQKVNTKNDKLTKLYKEGFLLKQKVKKEKFDILMHPTNDKKEYITYEGYVLKPEAKKLYNFGSICVGEPELVKVTEFSKPLQIMNMTISNVKYEYKISNFPKWLKKDDLLKKGNADFILTSDGWVHNKMNR